MATENESTLHKSVEKSKEPSRENHISLYDVLPSLGVAEEQTGRRKSDEYLKLFQHLINQSNDAIFIVDPVTGHYIDVNKKACIMLGYTYEELLTMSVMDVQELLPDIESWRDHVANICNKGSLMFNGVHKRKDGTVFPVEVSIKYVTHEKTNYITAFARDITVLKRTLEDLEKYKLLCSQINDLAYICDHEGNIIYTNDVFETLTGFKSSDFIGKPFASLFDESNLQEAMENFRKTLNGECPQFEVYFKDSGVLCEYKNVPLKDDNHNVIGVVGIARDITNRKKDSEKAFRENQLASIGELAAGVAHEINNPINGIINYAQKHM
jgi:PAS domain S-box-containing protein